MGRSKVVVRSIDDAAKRKATFQKRKVGVMKKAMEGLERSSTVHSLVKSQALRGKLFAAAC